MRDVILLRNEGGHEPRASGDEAGRGWHILVDVKSQLKYRSTPVDHPVEHQSTL